MTDIFRHTSMSACRFSPGTTFFAVAVEDHIIVRVTKTMQLVRTWACRSDQDHGSSSARPDIKQLEWSPDSKYILACAPRSGLTWIFGLADVTELPVAIITAGIEGLARVEWSPDSTAVLCFSEQRVGTPS
jgi:WD40 repeat protein